MKIWIRGIVSILLAAVLLASLQRLVMPKYTSGIIEGGYIQEYYKEKNPHQVLMIGDCEVYENFSPVRMWRDHGITSYIRGSAQQLTWQSYYLLKETLRYETPEVVVFNVLALKYNEPQKEEYNRMTLDGMKWSGDKAASINASMLEEESFVDYLFPILRYHSRITELEKDDLTYYLKDKQRTTAGYYMRVDADPYLGDLSGDGESPTDDGTVTDGSGNSVEDEEWFQDIWGDDTEDTEEAGTDDTEESDIEDADAEESDTEDADAEESDMEDTDAEVFDVDAEDTEESDTDEEEIDGDSESEDTEEAWFEDEEFWEESDAPEDEKPENMQLGAYAMEYLDKIRQLCEEKGIPLLLIKAPSLSPVWYDEWDDQVKEYADRNKLNYINFLDLIDEIGIDFTTDTYDQGLHMNLSGAEKCAGYLGDYLVKNYGLKDLSGDSAISADWKEKEQFYEDLKAAQLKELETDGEISNY